MDQKKYFEKDIQISSKKINTYVDTLRDASFLFEEKLEELSLLRRIGDIVGFIFEQEVFYRKFIDIILEETNAENCSFMLIDADTNRLVLKMARGRNDDGTFFEHPKNSGVDFSLGEGIAGKAALERKTILINEVSKDKRFEERETRFPIGSLLCSPLVFQEKVFGVINMSHTQPHSFTQNHKRIMELLCALVSSIIGNAFNYVKAQDQGKFKAMVEGVRFSILLVDPETEKIIECNRHTEEWLNYSKEELVSIKHLCDILIDEDREKGNQLLNKIMRGNDSEFAEISFMKKDGGINIGEISGSSIIYQEKSIIQLVIRDISERKKVERKLRETKEFLEKVIETTVDGIMICDISGNIIAVNSALERLSSLGKEKLIGEHASILIPEDQETRKMFREKTVELFEKDNTSYESALKRNDGKHIEVDINSSLIRDEKGTHMAGVSIFRDISERRRAEKEIRETRRFLENVIESSKDGIMISDPMGNILSVNSAIEEMSGYSRSELINQHTSFFTPKDRKIRKKCREKICELFTNGATYYESHWERKDSSRIEVEQSLSFIRNDQGDNIAGVSIIRDISERKSMEQLLLQSEKLKSLGELAGGVAHDFNNVLAAILGRAQLLKKIVDSPPKEQERRKSVNELKRGLEVIEEASLDGAETVRRIQEFARKRIDDKYFVTVNLNEIIDNALEFTRMKWKDNAESKGIKIDIKKEFSALPTTTGSTAELREVFINIISNAVDAMPQGGKIIIKTFKEDSHVCVKVKDTGVGIPEQIRDRIFDPFFTTKGPQSSGLGMSVSYGIIHRHRGTLTVNSVKGKGTTFIIKLPISEKVVEKEKEKPILGKTKEAKILVIEDKKDVRDLLSDILTESGHKVETVSDGSKGIKLFKEKKFDLVFTDLGMPGMSGWQISKRIKSINGRVPVVLITGWNIELKESEMKESGVDFVIHKPFEVNQVLSLVQKGMILRDQFKAT